MTRIKTEYEKELRKLPYSTLVYMCESGRILYSGDKDTLIARLVEAKVEVPELEIPSELVSPTG